MKIIVSETDDPFFNIASEEYILKNFIEDIFFLYINSPSVICGKHQNPIAETNYSFISKNNIPIIRRLSGGGAVYHDLGNLNFCFIQTVENEKMVDFKKYTQPIIDVLIELGLNANLGSKNEIKIDDLKVSGNAEHIWKKRVLHHGTLLFNSNLAHLQNALSKDDSCFIGNSVKSNRSNVTNIVNYLKKHIDITELIYLIINHVERENPDVMHYKFTSNEKTDIINLTKIKYSTNEWTYGYTSDYTFIGEVIIKDTVDRIEIDVKKGIITNVEFATKCNMVYKNLLIGKPHFEILNRLIFK